MSYPRSFLVLAGAAGLTILLQQVVELLPAIGRTDFVMGADRMRLFAGFGGRSASFVAGDVMLVGATVAIAHRSGIRVLGGVHLLAGALLLVLAPLFLVDARQVASGFGAEVARTELSTFRVFMFRLTGMMLAFGGLALLAGRRLLRAGVLKAE